MSLVSSEARFLGVDLQALWREARRPWLRMHEWPLLSWLTPAAPIRLLHSDGTESFWLGSKRQHGASASARFRFTAVQLPEDLVLRRRLNIPAMADADTAKAVELDARGASPFTATDLVWGSASSNRPDGMCQVDVALASRKQADQYLATQGSRLQNGATPELWAYAEPAAPIVLGGYGESQRIAYATRWRRVGYGLLFSALCLLVAIAATPTAQLRLRAIEAVHAYEAVTMRTRPQVREREKLLQSTEKLAALSEMLAGRMDPLRVLDRLTKILPDDTALQSFKLQGANVTIAGQTANSSNLMQILGNEPGLREVRAPSAATRMAGSTKESFVIVFSLSPQEFGMPGGTAATATATAAPASPAASASSANAAAGAAPIAVNNPAPPASSPGAPNAAAPSKSAPAPRPSTGGATFGGAPTRPASPAASAPPSKATP
jgi:general secretion pathway protein L